jgi:outer membrane protein assembly factor BamB
MAGKKVFLALAAEDQYRLPALLAAFAAWGLSPAVLVPTLEPFGGLRPDTVRFIRSCDVYLRLCTGATRSSPQLALADATFRQVLAAENTQQGPAKRKFVNVILDPAYVPDAQDSATLFIDTAGKTRALWFEELAVPLGVATARQHISRRGLLGMGVGATLTMAAGGVAAATYIQQQRELIAGKQTVPNSKKSSGQARWTIPLGSFSAKSDVLTVLFDDSGSFYAEAFTFSSIGLYALSFTKRTARLIHLLTSDTLSVLSLSVGGGLAFLIYSDKFGATKGGAFHTSDGTLAFRLDVQDLGTPIVAGGSFYCFAVSSSGTTVVGAFDLHTGAVRWQQAVVVNAPNGLGALTANFMAVAQGAVYISTGDHKLIRLDAATGKQEWEFLGSGQMTTPVVVDGVVYAGARDGAILALDAATGRERWQARIPAGISAPPALSAGALYIGSVEGFLYALDAATGGLYWSTLLGAIKTNIEPYTVSTAPVLYRNVVAVPASGVLFAYDLRTGEFRWQFAPIAGNTDSLSPPILYQGLYVIGSPDGKVYAVNP